MLVQQTSTLAPEVMLGSQDVMEQYWPIRAPVGLVEWLEPLQRVDFREVCSRM